MTVDDLAALKASAQRLDDIVPDAVPEPPVDSEDTPVQDDSGTSAQ